MTSLRKNSPWLITATDTGAGKTCASLALLRACRLRGLRAAAMKPVASGCRPTAAGLRNEDAELLAAETGQPYPEVNLYAFQPPLSPHLASGGQAVDIAAIATAAQALAVRYDKLVIEGVGGWRVFLDPRQTLSDLARAVEAQIILVVGVKLGCINHALLTAEAIQRDGLPLAGWIANRLDPDFDAESSIDTLRRHLPAPLLADFPCLKTLDVDDLGRRIYRWID
jgi:dethiobiotin synthetase